MTTLYRYQPVITPGPNGTDHRPSESHEGDRLAERLTELCTLDGWRYVSVPSGVTATVPVALDTWEAVTPDAALRERIKAESPHTQLIAERVIAQIRAIYPLDEELYFARIAVGALLGTYTLMDGEAEALAQYQGAVETAREWGRTERAKLGL